MSDDIPFDKSFDLETGIVKEIAPLVRAVCVGNAGPFTFKGTVTYIVGRGKVAVIDPGPDDDRHVGVLLDALRGETVSHIVLTHTHRDHSPAAAALKAKTGAPTFGEGRIASRARCISVKSTRSTLPVIQISAPIANSPTAT